MEKKCEIFLTFYGLYPFFNVVKNVQSLTSSLQFLSTVKRLSANIKIYNHKSLRVTIL
jgi:hypothetical protein